MGLILSIEHGKGLHSVTHLLPSAFRLADPSVSPCRRTLQPPTEAEWINVVISLPVLISLRRIKELSIGMPCMDLQRGVHGAVVAAHQTGQQEEVRHIDGGSTFGDVDLLLKDKWSAEAQTPQRTRAERPAHM